MRGEVGLAVSVGVARTKHLAKVASQVAKPDGLVVVAPEGENAFLERLPVGLIWGVGRVTQAHLANAGIRTIGELAATSSSFLDQLLGRALGGKLAALAANVGLARSTPPVERRRSVRRLHSGAGWLRQSCFGLPLRTWPTGWPDALGQPARRRAPLPCGSGLPALGR